MRLFIAINFPPQIRCELTLYQEQLQQQASRGRFSREENLHLTLVFLGEVEAERVGEIHQALEQLPLGGFALTLGYSGRFKRPGGDILWLGFAPSAPLQQLHQQLSVALRERGFAVEQRRFTPHLTLAREAVLLAGAELPQLATPLTVDVSSVELMLSHRVHGQLCYEPIYSKQL